MPRLHSGAATDRPEVIHLTLPSIPEIVWQHSQESHVTDIHKPTATDTHKNTHKPESKQRNDVESQTSPMKEISSQVSGSSTEPLLGNQTGSTSVHCPNDSKKQQHENRRNEIDMTTYDNGVDNIDPPPKKKKKTSQIEEQLVRDDITNELYIPLSCTIVLKRKKEMLYVPLDFENGLIIDAPWLTQELM